MKFTKDPLFSQSAFFHSPHNLIPPLILPKSELLDVGCNAGYTARILAKKGIVTDGIDINDKALKQAKKYCRNIYKRDLYLNKIDIPKIKYDYILFSDLLEHLPRPDLILIDAQKYLKPDGKIIASIPNIARFEIRINLLLGKFDYTDSGIMSKDHLRFFTHESAQSMFKECGYKLERILPTGLGHIIKIFPNLFAFQFIYIAKLT